jgi:hypothetical protein
VLSKDRVVGGLDAAADTFNAAQGRADDVFQDDNSNLLDLIKSTYPSIQTLEMETYTVII